LLILAYGVEVYNDTKRDREVLKSDLYGCSGIERTKNKVSEKVAILYPF